MLALFLLLVPALAPGDQLEQQRRLELMGLPVPQKLDLSRSQKGAYFQLEYEAEAADGSIPLRRMHAWKIRLRDSDGNPVRGAKLRLDGGMPQHAHGFSTLPSVKELSPGSYRVSGLKFHMPGWWVLVFSVEAGKRSEEFRFNLML
jgi:hypothetical protein